MATGMRLLAQELGDGVFAAEEDAAAVDPHDFVVGLLFDLFHGAHVWETSDAGVVDHDVQSSSNLHGFLNQRFDLSAVCDIRFDEDGFVGAMSLANDLVCRCPCIFSAELCARRDGVEICAHDQPGPLGGEGEGDGAA